MMSRRFRRPLHDPDTLTPWEHIAPAEISPYKELIGAGRLEPVGRRPPLRRYLADIWRRRDFLLYDARARVRSQNSENRLGSFWLVGKPVLDVAFYFIVFGLLLRVDRGVANYVAFVAVGVLMFRYSSAALTQSAGILRSSRAMIHAFSFPRACLVVSFTLREALTAGPLLAALWVMIIAIPPHVVPSWSWLLVFPLLIIQTIFNMGLAFLTARIAFAIPDIAQALSFLSRILLYGSGVIFPVERFITHPAVYEIMTSNPFFIMLSIYRRMLLDHSVPPLHDWTAITAWSIGLVVFGFIVFWRAEERYGRV